MKSAKQSKLKYAIFKFSDDVKQIILDDAREETPDDDNDYDSLAQNLPTDDVRYLAYDMCYCNKDGTEKSDIVFVSWHPQGAPIKKKMLCASSFAALKGALSVSRNVLEGEDLTEISSDACLEKLGGTRAARGHGQQQVKGHHKH